MNELNKLYAAMLRSWNGVIKEDSKILFNINGEEYPIRIDDKDMYLPVSNVLDSNVIDKVFFHPACENITSKETEVFKIVRKMTCMKLLSVFRSYPAVLFGIAGGAKPKKAWRQETIDMMEPLKEAKRSVRDELNGLFSRMHIELEEDGLDNRFIHFSVTKGGGRNALGERVYYKTRPSFPFYNEIVKRLARSEGQSDNQTVELNNHSVSRAALKLAVHLFQSILPAVSNPGDAEFQATTPVAARLISYLGAYGEIVDQLNRVQNTFRTEFDKAGIYMIDMSWTEHLEELPDIYRQVPVMDYNSHNTQDETQHSAMNRNDMAGLLSVSSVNNANNQSINNNGQQQQPNNGQAMMVGDYDLTPPTMQSGDRYVRTEIDQNLGRVLHHAINTMTGGPVVYHCTRRGNFLQRVEMNAMMIANQAAMMNNMGGMGNMGGMNPMMMGGMNPMMMGGMNPMMMMQQPVVAGGVAPSVYPDNSGYNNGPATW